jgi:phosphate transport system substrate-binding protein
MTILFDSQEGMVCPMRTPRVALKFLRPAVRGVLALTVAAVSASGASWAAGAPPQIVLAGSGGNLPITRLLSGAFMRLNPEYKIEVVAGTIGSTGAIRAAADGAIALGLVSRQLREAERNLGVTVLPYARTALVIGAHPSVADSNLTFEDLVNIYKGKKTQWKDNREIVVLTREPGDSTIEVVERAVPGFKEAYQESQRAKRWTVLFTDQQMNETLAKTPYALGFSDMGAITAEHLTIKVLNVNGVFPLPQHVLAGRYPLVKTLGFAFRPEKLHPGAKAFMEFVKSKEGARVMRLHGYLPGP